MLPKKKRLTKKEFSEVFKKGTRKKVGGFLIVSLPCASGEEKVSVVCSKKIAPQAVLRNKVRRRIYDCLKRHGSVWAQSGSRIIVIPQGAQENTPYNTVCDDLLEALKGIMITG